MYLSKCLLNTVKPINSYNLHRDIWKFFPDLPDKNRDFLFRVENIGNRGPKNILLQSMSEPVSNDDKLVLLKSKPVDYKFKAGQHLHFLIRANPTKKIIAGSGKKGNQGKVRVPLIDETEIINWLQRQLIDAAEIHEATITQKNIIYFRKGNSAGKIVTVTYSGLLVVKKNGKIITENYFRDWTGKSLWLRSFIDSKGLRKERLLTEKAMRLNAGDDDV
jgi:CRISPR system Cascade subunit CasE